MIAFATSKRKRTILENSEPKLRQTNGWHGKKRNIYTNRILWPKSLLTRYRKLLHIFVMILWKPYEIRLNRREKKSQTAWVRVKEREREHKARVEAKMVRTQKWRTYFRTIYLFASVSVDHWHRFLCVACCIRFVIKISINVREGRQWWWWWWWRSSDDDYYSF